MGNLVASTKLDSILKQVLLLIVVTGLLSLVIGMLVGVSRVCIVLTALLLIYVYTLTFRILICILLMMLRRWIKELLSLLVLNLSEILLRCLQYLVLIVLQFLVRVSPFLSVRDTLCIQIVLSLEG